MVVRRPAKIIFYIAAVLLALGLIVYYLPLNTLSIQQKPNQAPQKLYDYYEIFDEASGESLMYVPLVVNIGDELITETNKRYRIVKVAGNKAYARFVENLKIP